jgi:predicted transcriptional regulator
MDKGLVERSFKHTMDKGMVSDRKRRTCYSLTSDGKEIAKRIKDIRRDLE